MALHAEIIIPSFTIYSAPQFVVVVARINIEIPSPFNKFHSHPMPDYIVAPKPTYTARFFKRIPDRMPVFFMSFAYAEQNGTWSRKEKTRFVQYAAYVTHAQKSI